jgi:hypothetical protein
MKKRGRRRRKKKKKKKSLTGATVRGPTDKTSNNMTHITLTSQVSQLTRLQDFLTNLLGPRILIHHPPDRFPQHVSLLFQFPYCKTKKCGLTR